MKERFIEAGQIVNTHGVRGEVRIMPWTDSASFLGSFKALYVDGRPYRVTSAREHKGMLIAALEGVENVNDAVRLKGRTVSIDREDEAMPEGRFFIADLIGASVTDERGERIGTLTEVIDAPAGLVYVVSGDTEHLIPDVPEFILSRDADAGVVTVRLIEGM